MAKGPTGLRLYSYPGAAGQRPAIGCHPDGQVHQRGRPPIPSTMGQNMGQGRLPVPAGRGSPTPHLWGNDRTRLAPIQPVNGAGDSANEGEANEERSTDPNLQLRLPDDRTLQREDSTLKAALEQAANQTRPGVYALYSGKTSCTERG